MKTVAIIQARMGSTRLPGKVLKLASGLSLIDILLQRLSKSKMIQGILVATTDKPEDDELVDHLTERSVSVFRGDEKDVLDRYYQAASSVNADVVIRITGDCPLIDPTVVDQTIELFCQNDVDYASNVAPATFPDGLDVEVFTFESLERAWKEAKEKDEREHVTVYIRESGCFKSSNFMNRKDCSFARWTVDEPEDLEVIKNVLEYFHPRTDFDWLEVLELQDKMPELFEANRHFKRNEGRTMNSGQKLWERAKNVIPGGNMLLSKKAEMFLPDFWPAYYSKAEGCTVWDLDDNSYIDMSIMGVGTNILGYSHPEVDAVVAQTVAAGNMSTLNSPEEVNLAERLIELHPFAEMAKFCRSGGEANSVAIRIARAASGRDKVAFCGYHGWHDWYLAANLGDEKVLAGHLLPGLAPNGVPEGLSGSILPFNYNKIEELEALVRDHKIGVIKMEVSRNMGPEDNFLHKVRELATANNIVLIFDECTSGFRETFGGLHKKYGVEPDLAIFGKALGNGYAVTSVIGRREVMEAAQSTFISSTFWTERIGSAAALKTLEVMERERSWEQITQKGLNIKRRWQEIADSYGLEIEQWGLPALCGFDFKSKNNLEYRTFLTQEMLAKGFLAGNTIYSSIAHSDKITDDYFEHYNDLFSEIAACESGNSDINELLQGPVCHTHFRRLN